jgi:hypothetical protein
VPLHEALLLHPWVQTPVEGSQALLKHWALSVQAPQRSTVGATVQVQRSTLVSQVYGPQSEL